MSEIHNEELADDLREKREAWLVEHYAIEEDVLADDKGEFIYDFIEQEDLSQERVKVYLPEELNK